MKGGTGAYLVNFHPGDAEEFARYCAAPPIEILANSTAVQAVRDRRSGVIQAVFHVPGELRTDDMVLRVDAPLILMLRNNMLSVADPLQDPGRSTVQVTFEHDGVKFKREISLPNDVNSGKTVVIPIRKGVLK